MKDNIVGTLRRFYGLKFPGANLEQRLNGIRNSLVVSRCKSHIAMLDEEKYTEVETLSQETTNFSWLQKVAPGFPADGSKITIIHKPSEFYSLLVKKCRTAQFRITLASLYLGTGKLEADLVEAIRSNLQNTSDGNLKVKILLDYMRGSRGQNNSRTMLKPLLDRQWAEFCSISLYHTPKLRGFLKAIIPQRFNELVGLQHMKLYIFDDTLVISGANLSHGYFTNRQDRYVVIEDCKDLCDFYSKIVDRVCEFSFRLLPDGSETFDSDISKHPFKGKRKEFTNAVAARIKSLFENEMRKRSEITKHDSVSEADTWIFPLIEMGQLNIKHDSMVTLKLIQSAPAGATLRLATGYFNLIPAYKKALINNSRANFQLLTAHPTANGFFGAKGVAGSIPAAYTKIEKSFCKACEAVGQEKRVTLWEFARTGWTYHAKGLWYTLPGHQKPCLTLIGSPNFGYRSVSKDLETQVALVTKNERLQEALQNEQARLFSSACPVNSQSFTGRDRAVPIWVCAAVVLFRYFF
ncbi:CDP-diacylglycerol--glycerol-3-phosphate 3-phosphatidyltransferase, mitochondrial [Athalia rosae]|uniref:CDP-diacylglycerol--glycerol-3-phosphate 3-phosphatidyltransferase, mitochondrial n=1 Tax=Athalia rosae TaxID=37344 RepID=UPI0020339A3D|nr:CDP-diacylglycerol--glycerol-3-phosphate 3-phosphatidyltransferase, mitochondrial [Athalia rosae]